MSVAVLNSRFLTRLLTLGEEDIKRVYMLKESISCTACGLTMLILSKSVTFNVTITMVRNSISSRLDRALILLHICRLTSKRVNKFW